MERQPATPVPARTLASAGSNRGAYAALSMAMLLSSLGTSIANVALPTLVDAFGASLGSVQWIVLAYLLAVTTLIVGVGRLGDWIGRRKLLLIGIALFTLASALCGLVTNLGLLIAARALQGMGAAIMLSLSMALVGDIVPRSATGTAMGLLGTMSATGTALGPTLGGFLVAYAGWPSIFLVNIPLGLTALTVAWRDLPADKSAIAANRIGFDFAGTVVLALTLGSYALSMTVGRGRSGLATLALLIAAIAGAILFVHVEKRARNPLIQISNIRDRSFRAALIMSFIVSTVVMTTLVVGPFYLSKTLGLDATSLGLVMSVGPLVTALAGLPSGRIVDKLGPAMVAVVGLSAMFLGCGLLAFLPASLGIPGYLSSLMVLTTGYALFQTANNTGVMKNVAADQRGVISGMLNLSRNLGLITGTAAMGAVFASATGKLETATVSPEAVESGMSVTFVVAAALILVALGTGLSAAAKAGK